MKAYYKYKTEFGEIYIAEEKGYITDIKKEKNFDGKLEETKLIKDTYKQIKEYFMGKRKSFSIPLKPKGTEFQKKVWESLLKIPYGETRSYKDIAKDIGNEKASRAVGGANNKNPIFIIIPCHRVIGASGNLVGYGGGIKMKEKLLQLEKTKNED
ncbi:methylated-DNA--[protein]-cysteine S-methyltransferase [Miniphocaeibacter massiliensis]|uniref:methylated-DNA--[protein]-cysteine S-methyltransferase n=1 Tax=Miniphocaeibacter massiliensis TaxID=2041841 RepID=UPI000C1C3833|nr:methylated-DNA--[protein]-cysteine S-methyltransferase [Miniphocaeibacter massiliensis]